MLPEVSPFTPREALGNVGALEDAPALEQALDDPEPLVREHAAWALKRLTR